MKRSYRKVHRYKRKKSIFRRRFLWLGILILFIIGAFLYFLYFSPVFQVEKIIVSGQERVPKKDIEAVVERKLENRVLFIETKSIFVVDTGEIRKDILAHFPQIAEVEVSRGFFDAINILVIERLEIGVWCQDSSCFLLDTAGIIFEEVIEDRPDLILIEGSEPALGLGERVIEQEKVSQLLEIKSKLQENLGISITEVFMPSDDPWRMDMRTVEGWDARFNLKKDLNQQIQDLGLVLEELPPDCSLAKKRGELEYIDLRFNRIFCK